MNQNAMGIHFVYQFVLLLTKNSLDSGAFNMLFESAN